MRGRLLPALIGLELAVFGGCLLWMLIESLIQAPCDVLAGCFYHFAEIALVLLSFPLAAAVLYRSRRLMMAMILAALALPPTVYSLIIVPGFVHPVLTGTVQSSLFSKAGNRLANQADFPGDADNTAN